MNVSLLLRSTILLLASTVPAFSAVTQVADKPNFVVRERKSGNKSREQTTNRTVKELRAPLIPAD